MIPPLRMIAHPSGVLLICLSMELRMIALTDCPVVLDKPFNALCCSDVISTSTLGMMLGNIYQGDISMQEQNLKNHHHPLVFQVLFVSELPLMRMMREPVAPCP